MKTTPLILGIASDTANRDMIQDLFSQYYGTNLPTGTINRAIQINRDTVQIAGITIEIVAL